MFISTISICRDFPIINGFVRFPPNSESSRTEVSVAEALVAIPGSYVVRLSHGSGSQTGGGFGQQEFLRVSCVSASSWPAVDPAGVLSAL